MPSVCFRPGDKPVTVPEGTDLLSACRKAGFPVEAPCGGRGTCGRCMLRLISGTVNGGGKERLDAELVESGYILACQSKVGNSDLELQIPDLFSEEASGRVKTGEVLKARERVLGEDESPEPLVKMEHIRVPPPDAETKPADLDRLFCALGKSGESCSIVAGALRQLPEALRQKDGDLCVWLADYGYNPPVVIEARAGTDPKPLYGVAIDVGTTTIAVQLVDLQAAEVAEVRTGYNEQVSCGEDIISRINYARKPERLEELSEKARASVNALIDQLCRDTGISRRDICSAVVAGNTTMMHLMSGVVPEYLRLEPFAPAFYGLPVMKAGDAHIDIHPEAPVYTAPAVGSYVGGDITTGLICSGFAEEDQVSLFIDVGTNGEIVIGNSEFLMSCACSAGPAFEGGGVAHGMRAAPGAIEDVKVDSSDGTPSIETIGGGNPKGICGSGMIALVANLFTSGWIDAAGKLDRSGRCPGIRLNGRKAEYVLAEAGDSGTGEALSVTESDIQNIIRAKAAIYSASALLLEQVGLGFDDVARVYIAGGFGHFLDLEKCITIGMFPDIPRERFAYLGNACLTGAAMLLVSGEYRRKQQELVKRITNFDLGTTPDYMNQFTAATFLPHTEPERFPSVSVRTAPGEGDKENAGEEEKAQTQSDDANNKKAAKEEAARRLREELSGVDLQRRCRLAGLGDAAGAEVTFRMFGQECVLNLDDLAVYELDTGQAVHIDEQVLLLQLIKNDLPLSPDDRLVSFRDLSGGAFYYSPFRKRSLDILLSRFGDDIEALRSNLDRFDYSAVDLGDLGAKIHAFGHVYVTLIYRRGDEELPAEVDMLFNAGLKRVYGAEDAAVLAGRICVGLL